MLQCVVRLLFQTTTQLYCQVSSNGSSNATRCKQGAKYTHAFTPVIKQQQRYVTTTTTITKIRVNIGKLFRKKYMMYK